ncbi:hypothetical protein [Micromonospora sp. NPDC049891]|uniref:hypothetical protein n=1 Tax=Micromonospora sp. NPDC049891 TaxID=3155655 RepID=UPI0033DD82D1
MPAADTPGAGLTGTDADPVGGAAGLVGAAAPGPAAGLVGTAAPGATARPEAVPLGGVADGEAAEGGFASDRFMDVGATGGVGGCGRRTCASGTGTRPAGFASGLSSPPSAEPPGR